jgi:hypothetical protein
MYLNTIFKCMYHLTFRLKFENILLRNMFSRNMEKLRGGGREFHWDLGKCDLLCRWDISEKSEISTNVLFVRVNLKSDYCHTLNEQCYILNLKLSGMECQLDSSGSTFRYSDGTTLPAKAMHSVPVSEIATQKLFQNLKCAAVHYYILYCIDLSEHCAVAVWPSGWHSA